VVGDSNIKRTTVEIRPFFDNAKATTNLLMSGVLHRYPEMKFAIVESGASWVPFMLEALDVHYLRYRPWEVQPELSADLLPSDVFRRQVFVNTWYENLRADDFALLPVDNIMFETDYPHPTCLFGSEVRESLEQNLTALSPGDREKIAYRNAMRCFGLKETEIGPINGVASVGAQL
jgi:predicted TIM-barrel fold metal-dependent hydrolase